MSADFDSFNASPLDAFIQSALFARNAVSENFVPVTVALSIGLTPTVTRVKYPLIVTIGGSRKLIERYRESGGVFTLYDAYQLPGGGNIAPYVSPVGTLYYVERYYSVATIPAGAKPGAPCTLVATCGGNAVCEVYRSLVQSFDWVPSGPLVGVIPADSSIYAMDFGPVNPGERWYIEFMLQNDYGYLTIPFPGYKYMTIQSGARLTIGLP